MEWSEHRSEVFKTQIKNPHSLLYVRKEYTLLLMNSHNHYNLSAKNLI